MKSHGRGTKGIMVTEYRNASQRDTVGGVFLDSQTLDKLKKSADGAQFTAAWLGALGKMVDGMRQCLLALSAPGKNRFEPTGVWPEGAKPEPTMMKAVESCLKTGHPVIVTLDAEEGGGVAIGLPVAVNGQIRGAVGVTLEPQSEENLRLILDQIQWSSGWVETLIRRSRVSDSDGLMTIIDLLATSLHHDRFQEAATATATELATALQCERVAIGFMKGEHAQVRALSHSANFVKTSNLVRAMESAMDEAIDQQATVVLPEPDDAPERVIIRHNKLRKEEDAGAICTVTLTEGRNIIGAIVLERPEPFDREAVQLCELAAALIGPTLDVKRREDRWLLVKAWDAAKMQVKNLVGPRHAALKLAASGLATALIFFTFATGNYRVSAKAVIEGSIQRAISAPVAGYLSETGTRAGDIVKEGEIIVTLDMTDLRLERLKWTSQRSKQQREYSEAMARKERSRARILEAQIQQADSQLALIQLQLDRMRITAPFDGLIVSGDLSQALGAPVERGDVLFEIAPLDDYRIKLKVDERDIGDIQSDQVGTLVLSSSPDQRYAFTVNRVTPVSTAEDGLNFFMVEGQLDEETVSNFRPGMEGIGKIEIGERRLIWIWTRKAVLWVKMFFWSWMP